MKKTDLSYIELSKKNLIHNLKTLKDLTKKAKIVAVVKGNAYGHGQNEVAKILEPFVDYFQVNSIFELKLLRKISRKKTFVLGYVEKNDLSRAIKLGCILSVFSLEQMSTISAIAKSVNMVQEIHLPIDAYLGREGFLEKELPKIFTELKKYKNIKLTGIYAHFANIEDTNNFTHAEKQINKYKKAIEIAEKFGFKKLQTHISATSGLLVYEKEKGVHPLVRLGIGVYGMWPSGHIKYLYKNKIELKPVLSWKTKIAQIKTLSAGSTIGYGLTHMVYVSTRIAVIPQGYADGLDRGLSNKGEVLIRGTRCKILGRVAMNMFVANVNHLKDIKTEDEVVIIGKQRRERITAEEIAEKIDTINYEITTRLSPLLPRIVI
ncbi:MAG: alanine racemase [Parcubacteria group bacterium GW2011_GWF2_38_8]|nr:MAG: alanine racemase [Parcubacteria group bacterium GW2011_GWF2_38_8]